MVGEENKIDLCLLQSDQSKSGPRPPSEFVLEVAAYPIRKFAHEKQELSSLQQPKTDRV